jgi:hypothetical protein
MSELELILEFCASMVFLVIGVWATIYGYGLVGNQMIGSLQWNPGFRRHLRWLGPAMVAISIVCVLFESGDILKLIGG